MVISAGKFKARCLKLMDQVNETHETITITKRGRPVARLVPYSEEKSTRVLGYMKGLVLEESDLVSPIGERWDASADGR